MSNIHYEKANLIFHIDSNFASLQKVVGCIQSQYTEGLPGHDQRHGLIPRFATIAVKKGVDRIRQLEGTITFLETQEPIHQKNPKQKPQKPPKPWGTLPPTQKTLQVKSLTYMHHKVKFQGS